ncbi:MAG: DUF2304 domain-containing protein [Alicyclobacillus sp.]|nr:DUF2304 domain-containing protein [Alicyclobacillus sp.]
MNLVLRCSVLVLALAFAIGNLYLLSRRRIGERTMLLWLVGLLFVIVIAAFPGILNGAANALGVSYPPALLYLLSILFLLTVIIYQSTQISRLEQRLREVGQSVAILDALVRGQPEHPLRPADATAASERPIDLAAAVTAASMERLPVIPEGGDGDRT